MSRAKGAFDVKITPIDADRLRFEKQLRGDFEGTSLGEMLTTATAVEGSAGYVAREQLTGALHGKRGSFKVQHLATMRGGSAFQMRIELVPDSGTGELVGIRGSMTITIEPGGKHFYELDYDFAR